MSYAGKTALITGASSGIGAAFANALAARGAHLVLVARSADKLNALAADLRSRHHVDIDIINMDLAREEAAAEIQRQLRQRNQRVSVLVNNAGFSTNGAFETISASLDHQQIMLNVAAVVSLTHACIPEMLEQGEGSVINVGSTTSFYPLPQQAVYAASKAFVLSFSEALWVEYRQRGIRVLALCPGATDTAFFNTMGRDVILKKHTPEKVVEVALSALERNRHYVIPGLRNMLESALLPRLLPRSTVARLVGSLSQRIYKS
jgi:short-subunit dehydrogenase